MREIADIAKPPGPRKKRNGYLCRIKLPLPVKFVAQLADIFPGKRIRMTEKSGYLCIFDSQND